jgi:MFS family permease
MTRTLEQDELRALITQKRTELDAFVAATGPRKRRLLNVTIWGGTLAAALTAGPAAGGQSFTAWLTSTLGLESPSWRLLCAAAFVSSVAATVATQLLKSHNLEERTTRALSARARLESLDVGVSLGRYSHEEATDQYLKCLEDVALLRST